VHGAMRAAVMEGADFLTSREFEDELVRLGRGYLGYATRGEVGDSNHLTPKLVIPDAAKR
jgi:hypothetical protein